MRSHHETGATEMATVATPAMVGGAPVCEAIAHEADAVRAEETLLGEYTILKFASFFDDHREVAALAKTAGARAESYFDAPALLDAETGARFVGVLGLEDVERVAPYLIEGSLADLGEDGVAIGDALAAAAKLRLGDSVRVFRTSELLAGAALPTANMRVAAIFALPGEALHHDGERLVLTRLSTAQRLAVSEREGISGLLVWSGDVPGAKPAQWLGATGHPGRFQVFEQAQARRELLATAREACEAGLGPPSSSAETARAPRACDLPALIPGVAMSRGAVYGVARLQVPTASLEEVARTRSFSRVARRLETSASVVSASGARSIEVFGGEAADRKTLELMTLRGSVMETMDGGGIALSERLAGLLSVDVGDDVFVSVSAEDEAPRAPAFRARVGAVLSSSTVAAERVEFEIAWMSTSVLRERSGRPSDDTPIAVVWVAPSSLASAMRSRVDGAVTDRPGHVDTLRDLAQGLEKQCR